MFAEGAISASSDVDDLLFDDEMVLVDVDAGDDDVVMTTQNYSQTDYLVAQPPPTTRKRITGRVSQDMRAAIGGLVLVN